MINETIKRRINMSFGMLLLGIWLILTGLFQLVPMPVGVSTAMAVIALIAGILVLIGR